MAAGTKKKTPKGANNIEGKGRNQPTRRERLEKKNGSEKGQAPKHKGEVKGGRPLTFFFNGRRGKKKTSGRGAAKKTKTEKVKVEARNKKEKGMTQGIQLAGPSNNQLKQERNPRKKKLVKETKED